MVTNTDSYIQLIEYLTENLTLFETVTIISHSSLTVMEVIEQELSAQIIAVCSQNPQLTFNQRNLIIREADAIVSDLDEIFSTVSLQPATEEQILFIKEFATLIKNIFDNAISTF
jgi:hypothetical protein